MVHQIIWRKHKTESVDGSHEFLTDPPLPKSSGSLLLYQITHMPKGGRPIPFARAATLFLEEFHEYAMRGDTSRADVDNFRDTFVAWISAQGFWIELNHTEYIFDSKEVSV